MVKIFSYSVRRYCTYCEQKWAWAPTFLIFFFLNTVVYQPSIAQSFNNPYSQEELLQLGSMNSMSPGLRSMNTGNYGTKGSPFAVKKWTPGIIKLKKKESFSQKMNLNIDLQQNLLYISLSGNTIINFPANLVDEVILYEENDSTAFESFSDKIVRKSKSQEYRFYKKVHTGKYQLLKYHMVTFSKADFNQPYGNDNHYDEYKVNPIYYLRIRNGIYKKVVLKKKSIMKALANRERTISNLIKKHKLVLDNEEDIVKLLRLLEAV